MMNSLQRVSELGQFIWLDDMNRELVSGGRLKQSIDQDGLRGITFNPSGFRRAMEGNPLYEGEIRDLLNEHVDPKSILEAVSMKDVQMAADAFHEIYDRTEGWHGYVSVWVDPHLARDTEALLQEARRLWRRIDRPNIYITVPATRHSLAAARQLIREGLNINVNMLFGIPRYREAANAFMEGLERRLQDGKSIDQVRSVASFYLCALDSFFDPVLSSLSLAGGHSADLAASLEGRLAIAVAKVAYQTYQEIIASDRWRALANEGARPQWLVWTGTCTESLAESDLKYVEALIGPDSVAALPETLLDTYRQQGQPLARLDEGMEQARRVVGQLRELDLDFDRATQQLAEESLKKICRPFEQLLHTLAAGNVRGAIEVRRCAPLVEH